jgi:hypothetical protein
LIGLATYSYLNFGDPRPIPTATRDLFLPRKGLIRDLFLPGSGTQRRIVMRLNTTFIAYDPRAIPTALALLKAWKI